VVATLLMSVVNTRLAAQVSHQALTDELTGALNRRALRQQAPELVTRAQASGRTLAVLLLDIDHFKRINDTHGHGVGDEVLREVVTVLRSQLRPEALVTRFGGEEFALVVPVRDAEGAQRVAERLRAAVATHDLPAAGTEPPLRVSTSVGLALLEPEESLESALRRADQALYRAKQGGRNRVERA
jgi:diguanylate cyclase (GGDEF)-like protein